MDVPFPGSAQRNNRCEKQASSQQETHMSVAGGGRQYCETTSRGSISLGALPCAVALPVSHGAPKP